MISLLAAPATPGVNINWASFGTEILAIIAIIGLLFAGIGWLYKRGADERELTLSIRAHSQATDNLAGEVKAMAGEHRTLESRVDGHDTSLAVHDQRIATNARDISDLQRRPPVVAPVVLPNPTP